MGLVYKNEKGTDTKRCLRIEFIGLDHLKEQTNHGSEKSRPHYSKNDILT